MSKSYLDRGLFSGVDIKDALKQSFFRLSPFYQIQNPIMFLVFLGATIITGIAIADIVTGAGSDPTWFGAQLALWLWFTIIFSNFSEAVAEGKGKAQTDSLRRARSEVMSKKLSDPKNKKDFQIVPANFLKKGDYVIIETGDFIPADGKIIEGIASIDESAVTGESASVIRESGGDCDIVTGGTRVLSDWIIVRISAEVGESFLDRVIGLVEASKRQPTPNETALSFLLLMMTIVFVVVCLTLWVFSSFSVQQAQSGTVISLTILVALLICLIPTTISGLLSAIGISGMQRLVKANVIASSGRAVEAAGDVNVFLLDKTGTITFGNRQAFEFYTAKGVSMERMAQAAELSSLSDETPEGRSIVFLAHSKYGIPASKIINDEVTLIPFKAEQRISGIVVDNRHIMKGAVDAIEAYVGLKNGTMPDDVKAQVREVAIKGGTPMVVCEEGEVLGVIYLKDIVKPDIKQRLSELRKMGIKSVMITGDNALTAAAIASEAGVDDFVAEANPETKLKYIRKLQEDGELVAMVGDGTNDAPALAQADVAVVMNSGTQAAKEAGNMIDLDSDPTKLIEIVAIGKQLLMTRGNLATFSMGNDLAKYFAIIPAAFTSTYPALEHLNVMGLESPHSAILSAVIFNALLIIGLIPLAIRGSNYNAESATTLLKRNIFIYGVGGMLTPFIGIKLVDIILCTLGLF